MPHLRHVFLPFTSLREATNPFMSNDKRREYIGHYNDLVSRLHRHRDSTQEHNARALAYDDQLLVHRLKCHRHRTGECPAEPANRACREYIEYDNRSIGHSAHASYHDNTAGELQSAADTFIGAFRDALHTADEFQRALRNLDKAYRKTQVEPDLYPPTDEENGMYTPPHKRQVKRIRSESPSERMAADIKHRRTA